MTGLRKPTVVIQVSATALQSSTGPLFCLASPNSLGGEGAGGGGAAAMTHSSALARSRLGGFYANFEAADLMGQGIFVGVGE